MTTASKYTLYTFYMSSLHVHNDKVIICVAYVYGMTTKNQTNALFVHLGDVKCV